VEVFWVDQSLEDKQIARLRKVREARHPERVRAALEHLRQGASGDGNLLELMIEGAKARCTVGEMTQILVEVFGRYEPINPLVA
jgi:methylmalonyl-CoA mutase